MAMLFGPAGLLEFRIGDLERVRFLHKGEEYVFDLKRGQGPAHVPSLILSWARDLAKGGKGFSYIAKSAMHKEIRRSNIEGAVRWAFWVRALTNQSVVKTYMKHICFEESRSIALAESWSSTRGLPWEGMVRRMAAIPKKWELSCRDDLFKLHVDAYQKALSDPYASDEAALKALATSEDMFELYRAFWHIWIVGESVDQLVEVVHKRAAAHGGWAARMAAFKWYYQQLYLSKAALEIMCGHWSEDANRITEEAFEHFTDKDDIPTVPQVETYALDNHTTVGKRNLINGLKELRPGEPSPKHVDIRWGALGLSLFWRDEAIRQIGPDYAKTPWEDVKLDPELWESVWTWDGMWFRRMFESAGITGMPETALSC